MKRILFIIISIFAFLYFSSSTVHAAVTGLSATASPSNSGKTWSMLVCATSASSTSGPVLVQYASFWCNGATGDWCPYAPLNDLNAQLYQVNSTVNVPVYDPNAPPGGNCGASYTFSITPSDPPYPCGRIQSDVIASDDNGATYTNVLGGGIYTNTTDCPAPTPTSGQIPTPGPSPTPATPPAIQALGIGNATSGQTTFSGQNKTSGRIQADSGSNWLNPARIRLTVNPGSSLTIKAYYVAFYDQLLGLQTEATFLTTIKSALTTDPSKGILLAYGHPDEIVGSGGSSTKKYYVFDSTASPQWQDITSNTPPYAVNSSTTYYIAESNTGLTNERATPYIVGWTITFKPPFGDRTMFTGAFVKDAGNLTSFFPELSPTILP